jgi:predicted enzyme related to lactoylglutathione lyase
MGLVIGQVAIDTSDPQRLAKWWVEQVSGKITIDTGNYVFVSTESGANLCFQKVAEPTPGKNRLHMDCFATDVTAEVERLLAAGATLVANHETTEGFAWTVLADPDGNLFCVVPAE